MKEYPKITDYLGCRLRILPTNFTQVYARVVRRKVDVVYADVTVLKGSAEPVLHLGNIPIFSWSLIGQIKGSWVGRPIVGTLQFREDSRQAGTRVYYLDDLEVECHANPR